MNLQIEMWPDEIVREIIRGFRLHQRLLAKGERPDTRPWGGIFADKALDCDAACGSPDTTRRG